MIAFDVRVTIKHVQEIGTVKEYETKGEKYGKRKENTKKMKIKYSKGCKIQEGKDVKKQRRKGIEENTIIITVASLLYD